MNRTVRWRRWPTAGAALVVAGCLLPAPPPPPRYFAPTMPQTDRRPVASIVRVGVVRSPIYLREQMTWRRSDVEYGFYDQRRWTELPATYVERALARELLVESGPAAPEAPLVTADLRAFEEVLAPAHEARVAVAVTVADPTCVRLRETFAASRPLDGDDPSAVARGMGEALDDVVAAVGESVRRAAADRKLCRR